MARRVEELLALREGNAVDYKLDASSPKNIVKDFVAFGNSAGGSILIGVDDDRRVIGLEDPQDVEEAVSKAIYTSTEPRQSPRISVLTQDEKEVVLVEAQYFQGVEPLKLKRGSDLIVYERVGSNSMPVTDEVRIEQIRRERRGLSDFDQLAVPGATIEDLDMDAVVAAFGARGVEVDESKLESHELAKRENGKLIPTYAGILIFGKDPNGFLPDAYLRAIRYPGSDKSGDALDSAEWRGMSLLQGVEIVERFIARNTGTAQTIPGAARRDIPHYDPSLLREILHNAVAHADFSRQGQNLNVSIFNDHMIVDSPGKLPSGMSFQALEDGVSLARNRAIMNILHSIGYVEKHGTVYAKARAAAAEGYPIPKWSEPGPLVRVTLKPHPSALSEERRAPMRLGKDDRAEEILGLLAKGERSAAEIGESLRLTSRQAQRLLKGLEIDGVIETNGASRTSPKLRYRLPVGSDTASS
jgi:ATP-dependent DNA helicase RecG